MIVRLAPVRQSLALTVQTTFKGQGAQQWGKNGKAGRGSYLHTKQEVAGSWRPAPSSSSSQSAAAAAASQPPPAMKEKTKKKPETQGSAFAALAGCLGCHVLSLPSPPLPSCAAH